MSTDVVNLKQQIIRGEKSDWFTILPTVTGLAVDTSGTMYTHPDPNIGLVLRVVTASETGAWTATINLTTVDPAGNTVIWYTSGAITTATTTMFYIDPAGGTNALFTIVPFKIPKNFGVLVDVTGTDTMNTTIYGCYV